MDGETEKLIFKADVHCSSIIKKKERDKDG